MRHFLSWFADPPSGLDGLFRAGLAHLWFVTLHPFEDGNGRIEKERAAYHDILERTQRGQLDVTPWLSWLLEQIAEVCETAETTVARVLAKARFWLRFQATSLNDRQRKVLNRLLDAGPGGFEGRITTRKYAGLAGNCRLVLGHRYVAHVEGRTRERAAEEWRGLRVPGYQVLFAILAEPELLNATVRRLADAAGTGKTAAAETLRRLQDENLVGEVKGRRFILEAKVLLERWIAGYATHVRPRLLIGTYRTADRDPEALERHVEEVLADELTWGFGGGAAAARLARFYRGERTVVHLEKAPLDLQKRLRAQRADDGPLVLLRAPGQIAFAGVKPRTVHPLLIYTELLVTDDPRAREAANEVWERQLGHLR